MKQLWHKIQQILLETWKDSQSYLKNFRNIVVLWVLAFSLPVFFFYGIFLILTKSEPLITVPHFEGISILDASKIALENDIRIEITPTISETVPRYFVIKQDLEAGAKMKKRRPIQLDVSLGKNYLEFPNLIGSNFFQIRAGLTDPNARNKYSIRQVSWVLSEEPFGTIIDQAPKESSITEKPLFVDLTVSNGNIYEIMSYKGKDFLELSPILYNKNIPFHLEYVASDPANNRKILNILPRSGDLEPLTLHIQIGSSSSFPYKILNYEIPSTLFGKKIRLVGTLAQEELILFQGVVQNPYVVSTSIPTEMKVTLEISTDFSKDTWEFIEDLL